MGVTSLCSTLCDPRAVVSQALDSAPTGFKLLSILVPAGTPLALVPLLVTIEAISYGARAFSLGLRLSANLLAGHSLLAIISGFILQLCFGSIVGAVLFPLPLALVFALFVMEFGIAMLQAYVFTLLLISYL